MVAQVYPNRAIENRTQRSTNCFVLAKFFYEKIRRKISVNFFGVVFGVF
jgi:hypothetical protein